MRVLLLLLAGSIIAPVYSQNNFTPDQRGHYVIVGSFAIKDNAHRYHETLLARGLSSQYSFLSSMKLYYVYLLKDQNVAPCLAKASELRKQNEFADAWVRYIEGDGMEADALRSITASTSIETQAPSVERDNEAQKEAKEGTTLITEDTLPEETEEIFIPANVTLANTEIFLSLYNARNDRVANGKVQVVDTDRGRVITEVPGNSYLTLPDPKNKSGNLSLICDVVGYRKLQKEINFNKPTADSTFIIEMGSSLIANFELVQYQRGDIRTLYNIYFFNDAAVMMPESKFELNSLLQNDAGQPCVPHHAARPHQWELLWKNYQARLSGGFFLCIERCNNDNRICQGVV